MIDPITLGAILGAAKNEFIDRPAAEQKRRSQLITLKFSPFTGRQAGEITQDPTTLGGAMQGASMGMAFQQANPKFGSFSRNSGGSQSSGISAPAASQSMYSTPQSATSSPRFSPLRDQSGSEELDAQQRLVDPRLRKFYGFQGY